MHLYIESISILYINDAISRPLRGDDRGAQKCCLFALSVFSCGCHPGRPSMHRRSPCRPSFCPRSFLFCKLGFSLSCLDRPQRLALKKWHCVEAKVPSAGTPAVFYLQHSMYLVGDLRVGVSIPKSIANRASQKIILCELFVEPRLVTLCSENTLDRFVPLYSYGCWHVWLFAAMAAMLASLKGRCAFSLLALQIYTYLH